MENQEQGTCHALDELVRSPWFLRIGVFLTLGTEGGTLHVAQTCPLLAYDIVCRFPDALSLRLAAHLDPLKLYHELMRGSELIQQHLLSGEYFTLSTALVDVWLELLGIHRDEFIARAYQFGLRDLGPRDLGGTHTLCSWCHALYQAQR